MEEGGKKFNTVEIVLMIMIALANDALTIIADIGLAIPVIGEILYGFAWLVDGFVWALLMFWYVIKLGVFGGPALVQTISGIASFVGIPGRTIGVLLGIWLVNHPKAAAVAALATGKVGGAEKALGEEAASVESATGEITAGEKTATGVKAGAARAETEVAEAGATAGKTAVETAPREITEPTEYAPERKPSEVPEAEKEAKKPEVSKEALGEELTPLEKLQKLFEETPREEEKPESEEEEEGEEKSPEVI
ncbi:MAG: hypothetical protein HY434_02395 [Candidatus Liptonbacteria bacterium]|nr:hypothetical protein [Candidatus Liptonbacteria bacterium]